jgi:hypothetical protein
LRIARVFPRRTRATPTDELAFVKPPDLFAPEVDEVHISVAFSYDMPTAERLAEAWSIVAPVKIGGPATGERSGEFVPGMYLKPGYTITSRGCPNRCWFCGVWRREGREVRELPIMDGWNVLDDNLLACSEPHIRAVFAMLARQGRQAEFTGGLEAARLESWHVDLLAGFSQKPTAFFAYDEEADYEPLVRAGKMLWDAGFTWSGRPLRCYVLIGMPGDTFDAAEKRLKDTIRAGFVPMAMLWRDKHGMTELAWRRFQREWARPAIIASKLREE